MRASPSIIPTWSVGFDYSKWLFVFSVILSPIYNTIVHALKDMMIYLWNLSLFLFLKVQIEFGFPGSSESAYSETESPCLKILKVDLDPPATKVYI